jgi:hypothetical protein
MVLVSVGIPQKQDQGLDNDHSNDRPIFIGQVRQLRAADVCTQSASRRQAALGVCLTNELKSLRTR